MIITNTNKEFADSLMKGCSGKISINPNEIVTMTPSGDISYVYTDISQNKTTPILKELNEIKEQVDLNGDGVINEDDEVVVKSDTEEYIGLLSVSDSDNANDIIAFSNDGKIKSSFNYSDLKVSNDFKNIDTSDLNITTAAYINTNINLNDNPNAIDEALFSLNKDNNLQYYVENSSPSNDFWQYLKPDNIETIDPNYPAMNNLKILYDEPYIFIIGVNPQKNYVIYPVRVDSIDKINKDYKILDKFEIESTNSEKNTTANNIVSFKKFTHNGIQYALITFSEFVVVTEYNINPAASKTILDKNNYHIIKLNVDDNIIIDADYAMCGFSSNVSHREFDDTFKNTIKKAYYLNNDRSVSSVDITVNTFADEFATKPFRYQDGSIIQQEPDPNNTRMLSMSSYVTSDKLTHNTTVTSDENVNQIIDVSQVAKNVENLPSTQIDGYIFLDKSETTGPIILHSYSRSESRYIDITNNSVVYVNTATGNVTDFNWYLPRIYKHSDYFKVGNNYYQWRLDNATIDNVDSANKPDNPTYNNVQPLYATKRQYIKYDNVDYFIKYIGNRYSLTKVNQIDGNADILLSDENDKITISSIDNDYQYTVTGPGTDRKYTLTSDTGIQLISNTNGKISIDGVEYIVAGPIVGKYNLINIDNQNITETIIGDGYTIVQSDNSNYVNIGPMRYEIQYKKVIVIDNPAIISGYYILEQYLGDLDNIDGIIEYGNEKWYCIRYNVTHTLENDNVVARIENRKVVISYAGDSSYISIPYVTLNRDKQKVSYELIFSDLLNLHFNYSDNEDYCKVTLHNTDEEIYDAFKNNSWRTSNNTNNFYFSNRKNLKGNYTIKELYDYGDKANPPITINPVVGSINFKCTTNFENDSHRFFIDFSGKNSDVAVYTLSDIDGNVLDYNIDSITNSIVTIDDITYTIETEGETGKKYITVNGIRYYITNKEIRNNSFLYDSDTQYIIDKNNCTIHYGTLIYEIESDKSFEINGRKYYYIDNSIFSNKIELTSSAENYFHQYSFSISNTPYYIRTKGLKPAIYILCNVTTTNNLKEFEYNGDSYIIINDNEQLYIYIDTKIIPSNDNRFTIKRKNYLLDESKSELYEYEIVGRVGDTFWIEGTGNNKKICHNNYIDNISKSTDDAGNNIYEFSLTTVHEDDESSSTYNKVHNLKIIDDGVHYYLVEYVNDFVLVNSITGDYEDYVINSITDTEVTISAVIDDTTDDTYTIETEEETGKKYITINGIRYYITKEISNTEILNNRFEYYGIYYIINELYLYNFTDINGNILDYTIDSITDTEVTIGGTTYTIQIEEETGKKYIVIDSIDDSMDDVTGYLETLKDTIEIYNVVKEPYNDYIVFDEYVLTDINNNVLKYNKISFNENETEVTIDNTVYIIQTEDITGRKYITKDNIDYYITYYTNVCSYSIADNIDSNNKTFILNSEKYYYGKESLYKLVNNQDDWSIQTNVIYYKINELSTVTGKNYLTFMLNNIDYYFVSSDNILGVYSGELTVTNEKTFNISNVDYKIYDISDNIARIYKNFNSKGFKPVVTPEFVKTSNVLAYNDSYNNKIYPIIINPKYSPADGSPMFELYNANGSVVSIIRLSFSYSNLQNYYKFEEKMVPIEDTSVSPVSNLGNLGYELTGGNRVIEKTGKKYHNQYAGNIIPYDDNTTSYVFVVYKDNQQNDVCKTYKLNSDYTWTEILSPYCYDRIYIAGEYPKVALNIGDVYYITQNNLDNTGDTRYPHGYYVCVNDDINNSVNDNFILLWHEIPDIDNPQTNISQDSNVDDYYNINNYFKNENYGYIFIANKSNVFGYKILTDTVNEIRFELDNFVVLPDFYKAGNPDNVRINISKKLQVIKYASEIKQQVYLYTEYEYTDNYKKTYFTKAETSILPLILMSINEFKVNQEGSSNTIKKSEIFYTSSIAKAYNYDPNIADTDKPILIVNSFSDVIRETLTNDYDDYDLDYFFDFLIKDGTNGDDLFVGTNGAKTQSTNKSTNICLNAMHYIITYREEVDSNDNISQKVKLNYSLSSNPEADSLYRIYDDTLYTTLFVDDKDSNGYYEVVLYDNTGNFAKGKIPSGTNYMENRYSDSVTDIYYVKDMIAFKAYNKTIIVGMYNSNKICMFYGSNVITNDTKFFSNMPELSINVNKDFMIPDYGYGKEYNASIYFNNYIYKSYTSDTSKWVTIDINVDGLNINGVGSFNNIFLHAKHNQLYLYIITSLGYVLYRELNPLYGDDFISLIPKSFKSGIDFYSYSNANKRYTNPNFEFFGGTMDNPYVIEDGAPKKQKDYVKELVDNINMKGNCTLSLNDKDKMIVQPLISLLYDTYVEEVDESGDYYYNPINGIFNMRPDDEQNTISENGKWRYIPSTDLFLNYPKEVGNDKIINETINISSYDTNIWDVYDESNDKTSNKINRNIIVFGGYSEDKDSNKKSRLSIVNCDNSLPFNLNDDGTLPFTENLDGYYSIDNSKIQNIAKQNEPLKYAFRDSNSKYSYNDKITHVKLAKDYYTGIVKKIILLCKSGRIIASKNIVYTDDTCEWIHNVTWKEDIENIPVKLLKDDELIKTFEWLTVDINSNGELVATGKHGVRVYSRDCLNFEGSLTDDDIINTIHVDDDIIEQTVVYSPMVDEDPIDVWQPDVELEEEDPIDPTVSPEDDDDGEITNINPNAIYIDDSVIFPLYPKNVANKTYNIMRDLLFTSVHNPSEYYPSIPVSYKTVQEKTEENKFSFLKTKIDNNVYYNTNSGKSYKIIKNIDTLIPVKYWKYNTDINQFEEIKIDNISDDIPIITINKDVIYTYKKTYYVNKKKKVKLYKFKYNYENKYYVNERDKKSNKVIRENKKQFVEYYQSMNNYRNILLSGMEPIIDETSKEITGYKDIGLGYKQIKNFELSYKIVENKNIKLLNNEVYAITKLIDNKDSNYKEYTLTNNNTALETVNRKIALDNIEYSIKEVDTEYAFEYGLLTSNNQVTIGNVQYTINNVGNNNITKTAITKNGKGAIENIQYAISEVDKGKYTVTPSSGSALTTDSSDRVIIKTKNNNTKYTSTKYTITGPSSTGEYILTPVELTTDDNGNIKINSEKYTITGPINDMYTLTSDGVTLNPQITNKENDTEKVTINNVQYTVTGPNSNRKYILTPTTGKALETDTYGKVRINNVTFNNISYTVTYTVTGPDTNGKYTLTPSLVTYNNKIKIGNIEYIISGPKNEAYTLTPTAKSSLVTENGKITINDTIYTITGPKYKLTPVAKKLSKETLITDKNGAIVVEGNKYSIITLSKQESDASGNITINTGNKSTEYVITGPRNKIYTLIPPTLKTDFNGKIIIPANNKQYTVTGPDTDGKYTLTPTTGTALVTDTNRKITVGGVEYTISGPENGIFTLTPTTSMEIKTDNTGKITINKIEFIVSKSKNVYTFTPTAIMNGQTEFIVVKLYNEFKVTYADNEPVNTKNEKIKLGEFEYKISNTKVGENNEFKLTKSNNILYTGPDNNIEIMPIYSYGIHTSYAITGDNNIKNCNITYDNLTSGTINAQIGVSSSIPVDIICDIKLKKINNNCNVSNNNRNNDNYIISIGSNGSNTYDIPKEDVHKSLSNGKIKIGNNTYTINNCTFEISYKLGTETTPRTTSIIANSTKELKIINNNNENNSVYSVGYIDFIPVDETGNLIIPKTIVERVIDLVSKNSSKYANRKDCTTIEYNLGLIPYTEVEKFSNPDFITFRDNRFTYVFSTYVNMLLNEDVQSEMSNINKLYKKIYISTNTQDNSTINYIKLYINYFIKCYEILDYIIGERKFIGSSTLLNYAAVDDVIEKNSEDTDNLSDNLRLTLITFSKSKANVPYGFLDLIRFVRTYKRIFNDSSEYTGMVGQFISAKKETATSDGQSLGDSYDALGVNGLELYSKKAAIGYKIYKKALKIRDNSKYAGKNDCYDVYLRKIAQSLALQYANYFNRIRWTLWTIQTFRNHYEKLAKGW